MQQLRDRICNFNTPATGNMRGSTHLTRGGLAAEQGVQKRLEVWVPWVPVLDSSLGMNIYTYSLFEFFYTAVVFRFAVFSVSKGKA